MQECQISVILGVACYRAPLKTRTKRMGLKKKTKINYMILVQSNQLSRVNINSPHIFDNFFIQLE